MEYPTSNVRNAQTELFLLYLSASARKSAELEQLDLLTVQLQNSMFGIRQADKRQIFLCPIVPESIGLLRSGYDDFRIQLYELLIIPAQLRHVRAAEWSKKPPVENDQHIFLPGKIGKRYTLSIKIV